MQVKNEARELALSHRKENKALIDRWDMRATDSWQLPHIRK